VGGRILIVEDEQIIAADLANQLAHRGYEVVGLAIAGEEAVEIAGRTRPQAVLMDIRLAGNMDGHEAARLIQHATGAGIIFITAYPNTFLHDELQLDPPGICLGKPFSWMQLETALVAALQHAPPAIQ